MARLREQDGKLGRELSPLVYNLAGAGFAKTGEVREPNAVIDSLTPRVITTVKQQTEETDLNTTRW